MQKNFFVQKINRVKKAGFFSLFLILTACANPFNLKAVEEAIIPNITSTGTSATDIVAGATQTTVTAGGYKITASLGSYVSQPNGPSSGGYKIVNKQQISK